jgi:hypothetical protein
MVTAHIDIRTSVGTLTWLLSAGESRPGPLVLHIGRNPARSGRRLANEPLEVPVVAGVEQAGPGGVELGGVVAVDGGGGHQPDP